MEIEKLELIQNYLKQIKDILDTDYIGVTDEFQALSNAVENVLKKEVWDKYKLERK